MANNAILFRAEHKDPIRTAVKDYFKTTKWESWSNYVKHRDNREDFNPIRIRNDANGQRWILPLSVRDNPKFSKLKEIIQGATSGVKLVSIIKNDLPKHNEDGTTDYSIKT